MPDPGLVLITNDNNINTTKYINELIVSTPFSPPAIIYFEVLHPDLIGFTITNSDDIEFISLPEQLLPKGIYQISYAKVNVPSGVYNYCITQNGQNIIKNKIIILQ